MARWTLDSRHWCRLFSSYTERIVCHWRMPGCVVCWGHGIVIINNKDITPVPKSRTLMEWRWGTLQKVVSKKTSSMSRVSSLALSLAPIRFSPCMCKCHTIPTWHPFFLGRNFTLFCQNGGRTAQRTFETRAEMELSVYRLHLHINICQESHNCLN